MGNVKPLLSDFDMAHPVVHQIVEYFSEELETHRLDMEKGLDMAKYHEAVGAIKAIRKFTTKLHGRSVTVKGFAPSLDVADIEEISQ
jgi:hypothetical protein